MNRTILAWMGVVSVGLAGCATTGYASEEVPAGSGGVAVTVGGFHEALAPYGEWVSVGSYGNVWRPSVSVVGAGFRPYGSGGHWLYSDVGWSWSSDWDWGWAPFHYGRWILDPVYGWVWVPDTVWGPAWVTWRYGGGYVGWAPLAPVGFVEVESYHPYWCFVGHDHFVEANVFHYASSVDYHQAFAVTSPVTSTVTVNGTTRVWAGPPAGQIQQATGHVITPVHITAPQAGIVAPHSVNGITAPQLAHSGAQVGHFNGAVNPGSPQLGNPGGVHPGGTTQVGPTQTGPGQQVGPGGGTHASPTQPTWGLLHGEPNNPVRPDNPAIRPGTAVQAGRPQMGQPQMGAQPSYNSSAAMNRPAPTSAPYSYGYHAQPAPMNRAAPAAPTYRSAPAPTYRSAPMPTYRSAPASSYRPSSSGSAHVSGGGHRR